MDAPEPTEEDEDEETAEKAAGAEHGQPAEEVSGVRTAGSDPVEEGESEH